MANQELVRSLVDRYWERLNPVVRKIQLHARGIAMQEYQISMEQFNILRHIYRGAHSQVEIADLQQISPAAVSQVLDVLVERGLATRAQSTRDRRYSVLDLTDPGREMIQRIFSLNRQWMADNLAGSSDEELEIMLRAVDILSEAFHQE